MPKLSIREIYQLALDAGFTPHQAVTWTSIALAESGGRTGALNDKGEHSMGLWQVNTNAHTKSWGNLNNPENNARAAYEISRQGRDMRPWTTTHDSHKGTTADYRHYLPQVEAVTGVKGDPRGVRGYRSAMLEPLPGSESSGPANPSRGADEEQQGVDLDTAPPAPEMTPEVALDTDRDGLTDKFEKLAGTNARRADTDRDGLSDSYEAISSHTDPLSGDTDRDRVTDAAEIAAGTDPGRLPGTAGVIGTGAFAENSRKPGKDRDRDGLSDRVEKLVGTNHRKADTDGDRLPDAMEAARGTNPTLADTDGDGISDGLELQYHTNPLAAGSGLGGLGGPAGVDDLAGTAAAPGADPAPPGGESPLS